MSENSETLTPGSLTPQDTARILGSIGEAEQPRNEAGQFVSTKAPAETPVEPIQNSAPEGADAAPEETQPSGEENAAAGTEEAPPAVDAPAFWSADEKAKWSELHPDIQRVVADRERERDLAVRKAQDDGAKEKTEVQRLREEYQTKLNQVVPALANQLQGKWAKVNWTQLAKDHPADYVALKAEFEQDVATYQAVEAENKRLNDQRDSEFVREQESLLPTLIPAWKDEKVAKTELAEVVGYLGKQGIPNDVLFHPDGKLRLVNARQITIARKAMLYDRAQARVAKPSNTPKPAPQVQKPGSSDPGRSETQARQQQVDRLVREQSPEAAAALIRNML